MSLAIRTIDPDEFQRLIPPLATLLEEAVNGGAALGFLAPFTHAEAAAYWHSIRHEIRASAIRLVIAEHDGALIGCGLLALPAFPAMRHRTELQKLCVLASARGNGVGRALMQALHAEAVLNRRSLVVLTTRKGGRPQTFYRKLGYQLAGIIPGYTIDALGNRYDTALMCREI